MFIITIIIILRFINTFSTTIVCFFSLCLVLILLPAFSVFIIIVTVIVSIIIFINFLFFTSDQTTASFTLNG